MAVPGAVGRRPDIISKTIASDSSAARSQVSRRLLYREKISETMPSAALAPVDGEPAEPRIDLVRSAAQSTQP